MQRDLVRVERREVGGVVIPTVNARELHEFLEVGRDYTTWIKGRIEEYSFRENEDFAVFTETGENPQGGRPAKEYHPSLDMAKELAMVERTEKGREARKYFIECERRLREQTPVQAALPAPEGQALPAGIRDGILFAQAASRHALKADELGEYFYFRKLGLVGARAEAAFGMAPGASVLFEKELEAAGFSLRDDRSNVGWSDTPGATRAVGLVAPDAIRDFVSEICVLDLDRAIRTRDLYVRYLEWCALNARTWTGFYRFSRRVIQQFAVRRAPYKEKRRAHFIGIDVKPEVGKGAECEKGGGQS